LGFSGSGSNVLKPHTHNGLTLLDGGALDFNNITQSQSSAGMVFYSDGVHLQQLAYPGVPAGETLTAAAASTSPTWAAAGGAAYEFIEKFTAATASTFNCTLASPLALADFAQIICVFHGKFGAGALELQLANNLASPLTSAHYSWSANVLTAAGAAAAHGSGLTNFVIGADTTDAGSRGRVIFDITVYRGQGDGSGLPSDMMCGWNQVGTDRTQSWGGGYTYNNTGNITTINGFYLTNSLGNNFEAGATLDVYKITS
jgi:hypothetical protein